MVEYESAILNKAREALSRQGFTFICVTYLSYIPKRRVI